MTSTLAEVETLTALIDFYGLKKEGKVTSTDNTPTMVVNKNKIEGVLPILSHLKTKNENILGSTNLEKALVRQWVQFQVCWPYDMCSYNSSCFSLGVSTCPIRRTLTYN